MWVSGTLFIHFLYYRQSWSRSMLDLSCILFPPLYPRFQPWPRQFFGTWPSLHTQFPSPPRPRSPLAQISIFFAPIGISFLSLPLTLLSAQRETPTRSHGLIIDEQSLDRAKWGCETLVPWPTNSSLTSTLLTPIRQKPFARLTMETLEGMSRFDS